VDADVGMAGNLPPRHRRSRRHEAAMSSSALRPMLERAWSHTLQDLDPYRLVFDAVRALNLLHQPTIIAAGKAAPAMTHGALDALEGEAAGLVVTTDGTALPPMPASISVMRAAHPIPDERSVRAARAALELANTSDTPSLLVLISGGTSALLCAPDGMSLEEKQNITDELLRSGANIRECNTVRRHISRIKGGRLAAAFRGPLHCMILCDVVGGAEHDVGSGPACADPTTIHDAKRIIRAHLTGDVAATALSASTESLKSSGRDDERVSSLLAGPEDLARVFAHHLRMSGCVIETASIPTATAQELSTALVRQARSLEPGHGWVVACEPTLSIPKQAGRGGRAGWVALHALQKLPDDVVLWAAASDGVDGSSGASGACVSGSMRAELNPATVESHLVAHDDAPLHRAMGTTLQGVPTGTNLTDVYAVLRVR